MNKYTTMITPEYLSHWTVPNAVREYISNALDGSSPFEYEFGDDYVILTSVGITLSPKIFAMGYSQNRNSSEAVGTFGEGALVSMIPLLRDNKGICFVNGDVIWKPAFEYNDSLSIETLVINEEENPSPTNDYSVIIDNLTSDEIQVIKESCIYFRDDLGEVLDGSTGSIIKGVKGKLFVGGIFVTDIPTYDYSFNFKPEYLELNRDRKSVESWNLAYNTSILIKELIDPVEIAKLVEQRKPDVQNLQHRDDIQDIANACYDNLVEKHGENVVVCQWYDDQEKLEKQGYKNVVNISHGCYYEVVKQSPKYKEKLSELTEQIEVEPEDTRSPIEILDDWAYGQAVESDLSDIIELFRERGVVWK